jgi:hypothetical protein
MATVSYSSINVVNGEERADTPQVSLQVSGKRSPRGGDSLLIFLDLPNATPSQCADIARTLSEGYVRAPGGVTSALRLAIKLANDRALQLNKGAPPSQRLEGSLTCALVNEESVIIAQAGPAMAFARAASGAFEYIAPPADDARPAVGVSQAIEPYFVNFAPQPGDIFVITGSHSCTGVSDALVNACMARGGADPRMAAGFLNANVKQGRMIGVAFVVSGVKSGIAAPKPIALPSSRAPEAAVRADPTSAVAASAATAAATALPGAPQVRPVSIEAEPAGPSAGEAVRATANQAARSMQRSLSAFGSRLLPQETPEEAAQRSKTTLFVLAAIAVLIPIVIAVAVGALYFQFSGEAERQRARNSALAQVETASASTDPTQIKSNWGQALQLIGDYEAKNPEDTSTFAEAKIQARAQLDQISKITRVQPIALAQFDGAARRRLAASALGVYALNLDANSAEYYVLNPERNGTTGKPVALAFTDNLTSTTLALVDVAWATTNNSRWRTEGAVLFDSNVIYEYSSATGRASPMTLPSTADATPIQVKSGELYNNRVYLLDTGVGQIWRYPLAGDAIGEGDSYFRAPLPGLQTGLDLAVDGAVYVLQDTGAVLKYFNRAPLPFITSNLPEPFSRAVALAVSGTDPNQGSIYVLDSANGSVIELAKTGEFIRQLRGAADEFVGAQDLSLDPTSNTLYVATPERLYSIPVQPPAPPIEPTPTSQP